MSTDRRAFLRGGAAVMAGAAASGSAAADDKLSSAGLDALIEAHRAAEAEYDRRIEVYSEFERSNPWETRDLAENERLLAWTGGAGDDDALWDVFCYRPKSMQEMRRKADYLLHHAPQLEDLDGEWFRARALIESMAVEQ